MIVLEKFNFEGYILGNTYILENTSSYSKRFKNNPFIFRLPTSSKTEASLCWTRSLFILNYIHACIGISCCIPLFAMCLHLFVGQFPSIRPSILSITNNNNNNKNTQKLLPECWTTVEHHGCIWRELLARAFIGALHASTPITLLYHCNLPNFVHFSSSNCILPPSAGRLSSFDSLEVGGF